MLTNSTLMLAQLQILGQSLIKTTVSSVLNTNGVILVHDRCLMVCLIDSISGLVVRKKTHSLYSCAYDRSIKIWNLDEMAYVETL